MMTSRHGHGYSDFFTSLVDQYSPKIDMSIANSLEAKKKEAPAGFIREVYDALEEFCLRKGKRIRPILLLIGFQGYGGKRKTFSEIVRLASALELMHCFLLVQDDIIDNSSERRGGKTLHVVFQKKYGKRNNNPDIGSDIALVAADVLFTCAIEIISRTRVPLDVKNDFMQLFGRTYEMTAWGQMLDSYHGMSKKNDVGTKTSEQISILKTAFYTAYFPLLMGYVLAGGNSKKEKNLIRDFALPLGLAFQLRDDILGTFGSRAQTGKPTESDIAEGKLTFLVQHTFLNVDKRNRSGFFRLFSRSFKSPGDIKKIKEMITESGALDAALKRFNAEIQKSLSGLGKLSLNSTAVKALRGFVESLDIRGAGLDS